MKCRIDSGNTCRRCQRSGLPCIFVPRANASAFMVPASLAQADLTPSEVTRDLMRRVKAIEDHLGWAGQQPKLQESPLEAAETVDILDCDGTLGKLWESLGSLERTVPGPRDPSVWKRSTVKYLWQTYVLTFGPNPANANWKM